MAGLKRLRSLSHIAVDIRDLLGSVVRQLDRFDVLDKSLGREAIRQLLREIDEASEHAEYLAEELGAVFGKVERIVELGANLWVEYGEKDTDENGEDDAPPPPTVPARLPACPPTSHRSRSRKH